MNTPSGLDVRLYVVTDPSMTPADRLVPMCVAAVRGGATLVQLRDKQATDDDLLRQAAELQEALEPFRVPLVINDRFEVARRVGTGVHLGVSDSDPVRAREALGDDAIVGWSVESSEQLGSERERACSYLAASPVWLTSTKPDATTPLGPPGVAAIRAASRLPLVGIGGINTPERAAEVIDAGADGVAVVSGVFGTGDPESAAAGLRTSVDQTLSRRENTGAVRSADIPSARAPADDIPSAHVSALGSSIGAASPDRDSADPSAGSPSDRRPTDRVSQVIDNVVYLRRSRKSS